MTNKAILRMIWIIQFSSIGEICKLINFKVLYFPWEVYIASGGGYLQVWGGWTAAGLKAFKNRNTSRQIFSSLRDEDGIIVDGCYF